MAHIEAVDYLSASGGATSEPRSGNPSAQDACIDPQPADPLGLEFFDLDFTETRAPAAPAGDKIECDCPAAASKPEAPISDCASLIQALERQNRLPISKIGAHLVAEGHINERQLDDALATQKTVTGKRIGDILLEAGLVARDTLETVLIRRLGIPVVSLRQIEIDPQALSLVPRIFAYRHSMVPCLLHQDRLVVATCSLPTHDILQQLHFVSGKYVTLIKAAKDDIDWAIAHHYAYGHHESEWVN